MQIYHNLPSMNAQNALASSQRNLADNVRQLASGLRIGKASDDAAGLAISEKMRGQIHGLDRAVSNAQDGVSLIQTAEGALNEVHSMLQRMRELSVQAANGTLTSNDRQEIQKEVDQLKSEIDRISTATEFNTKKLLNGDASARWSADDPDAKLMVRGSIRAQGAEGLEISAENNYQVDISARAGKGQILKTNILTQLSDEQYAELTGQQVSSSGNTMVVNPLSIDDHTGNAMSVEGEKVASGFVSMDRIANFYTPDGRFLLEDPQSLTITQGDGQQTTLYIEKNDTLDDLTEKISDAVNEDLGQQELIEGEPAQATYIGGHPGPTGNMVTDIINGLKYGWLESAAKRIEEMYGIKGTGEDLAINVYQKAEYGTVALIASLVDGGGNVTESTFHIDLEDFKPATMPSGGENHLDPMLADRVVAHEMVHATMSMHMNWLGNDTLTPAAGTVPTWFKEGTAELIHGRNYYLKQDIDANGGTGAGSTAVISNWADGWHQTNEDYSGAYAAVRYLHENSDGIKAIMQDLAAGSDLDTAIANNSSYTDTADFNTDFNANGATWLDGIYASLSDDEDTGAIGGKDVDGGDILTKESVIDEDLASDFDGQPLSEYGWNVIWPDDTTNPGANPTFDPLTINPSFVNGSSTLTPESVTGTMVIHSAIAGSAGELSFSGDEALLRALGISELQESRDNKYIVTLRDAHTDQALKRDTYSGELLEGLLGSNVDLKLGANTGIRAEWNETLRTYDFKESREYDETIKVHLVDTTTSLHIGPNEGQQLDIGIGNVSSESLGVDALQVTDQDRAGRAITLVDRAIERISGQRSELGAFQNRLDHSINSLSVAQENLQASESRIRDLDIGQATSELVRDQLLAQAGQAMLGQANQMPQSIMQLLR